MTHECTRCGTIRQYENKRSWYNARANLNKTGELFCNSCAGIIGRQRSDKKPTGRPKGSKTSTDKRMSHSRPGAGKRLSDSVTFEQRMEGIAKRNGYDTYEEYRDSLPAWKGYRIDVMRITNKQPLHLLDHYEKRGVNGQTGVYTLDHIISIKKGFKEGISPDIVGHIDNLQMLPWEENITKGWR